MSDVTAYAPATLANLGPGYDVLGLALTGLGDRVVAAHGEPGAGVTLDGVLNDAGRLPRTAGANTAAVAATLALQALEHPADLRLTLHKGTPHGAGLGSSAASAVAGALAAATLALGGHLNDAGHRRLLDACVEAERVAAGVPHADNVAPALLGGVVLIRRYNPLEILPLPAPPDLRVVVATPGFSFSSREAREVLPEQVRLSNATSNSANLGALVAGFFRGDLELIGRALMDDAIVEPIRAAMIPGYRRVKRAALDAGALGVSIAGAGPSCFALTGSDRDATRIALAMETAWAAEGVTARAHVGAIDTQGARLVGGLAG